VVVLVDDRLQPLELVAFSLVAGLGAERVVHQPGQLGGLLAELVMLGPTIPVRMGHPALAARPKAQDQ
jgi:hypothetical protein